MPITSLQDTFPIPRVTAALGTAFTSLIPGRPGKKTKLSFLSITSGGTQHTYYAMRELSRVKAYAAAAGAATSIVLDRDPGAYSLLPEWAGRSITPSVANNLVAANDYLVTILKDGTWALLRPSAVATDADTGRVTLTVPAIGNAGLAANTPVWFLGTTTDTDPHYNAAHPTALPTVSTTTTYPAAAGAGAAILTQSFHPFSPIVLQNANATAASVIDYGTASYGD